MVFQFYFYICMKPAKTLVMTFTDFVYWCGDAFQYCFKFLKWLGTHHFNIVLIIIGFVATAVWLKMQGDYNKKAKEQGTLK